MAERAYTQEQEDAQELAARRAHDARLEAKYRGWKPLVVWYSFWTTMLLISAVYGLVSGAFGGFLVAAVLAALVGKYTQYLYNGGRRRVWFLIF
jgi:hypothetical protein